MNDNRIIIFVDEDDPVIIEEEVFNNELDFDLVAKDFNLPVTNDSEE